MYWKGFDVTSQRVDELELDLCSDILTPNASYLDRGVVVQVMVPNVQRVERHHPNEREKIVPMNAIRVDARVREAGTFHVVAVVEEEHVLP